MHLSRTGGKISQNIRQRSRQSAYSQLDVPMKMSSAARRATAERNLDLKLFSVAAKRSGTATSYQPRSSCSMRFPASRRAGFETMHGRCHPTQSPFRTPAACLRMPDTPYHARLARTRFKPSLLIRFPRFGQAKTASLAPPATPLIIDDTPERLRGKNRLKVSAVLSRPQRQDA